MRAAPRHGRALGRSTAAETIRTIERGVRYQALASIASGSGLSDAELAGLLGIPPRTLARRKVTGRFSSDESERIIRLGRVMDLAVALFEGDAAAAVNWLKTPKKALAGNTPFSYTRTEIGGREVERLIGQLEYGVFV